MGAVKSVVMASSTPAVEMGQIKIPVATSSAVPADPAVQAAPDAQGNLDAPSTPSVLSNAASPPSNNLRLASYVSY
jgi:hypothetical protein